MIAVAFASSILKKNSAARIMLMSYETPVFLLCKGRFVLSQTLQENNADMIVNP